MTEIEQAFLAELSKLRSDYLAHLPEQLAALRQLAARLVSEAEAHTALQELAQRLHKLAGSGGTFGLHQMSEQARRLEQTVQIWLQGDWATMAVALHAQFVEGIQALEDSVQSADAGVSLPVCAVAPSGGAARIQLWLVDDDALFGAELAAALVQFGYDVRLFGSLGEADAAMQCGQPDVLIVDVAFVGGRGAAELLDLQARTCPLLFISEQGDFQSRLQAVQLGARGFLLKPLDVPKLVDQLERILDEQQGAPYRVLIVDDDELLSEHYRLVLSAAGMEVGVLNQPEQVIERVRAFHPELILMDMQMPGYAGPDLAAVIRHHDNWVGLPIIYLSAETDVDQQIKAMGRGADDFLTKPIADAQLVSAVKMRAARSRQLADLMSKDSLTGLLKHSRIKEEVAVEWARSRRNGLSFCVVMADIDHFKRVNDTYGHAVGDRVIRAIAQLLKQRLRKSDLIGRYGGEEFVAILPECDAATAQLILEDVRERFAALRFVSEGVEFSCSLSAGIADSMGHRESAPGELLVQADKALYQAKQTGRNRVCLA